MFESISSALAGISLVQLAIIACMALFASVVGGVSGYGTGALMPLVLVPILGPEPVIPIVATSALFNNTARATAFRSRDTQAAADATSSISSRTTAR